MSGHGHVTPNADGSRARCGGPALCKECALEFAQKHYQKNQVEVQVTVSEHFVIHSAEGRLIIDRCASEARGRTYHIESVPDIVDVVAALWTAYQLLDQRLHKKELALEVMQKAIQHAKSERDAPSYVPPGGVQFVTIPAWVVEELYG